MVKDQIHRIPVEELHLLQRIAPDVSVPASIEDWGRLAVQCGASEEKITNGKWTVTNLWPVVLGVFEARLDWLKGEGIVPFHATEVPLTAIDDSTLKRWKAARALAEERAEAALAERQANPD